MITKLKPALEKCIADPSVNYVIKRITLDIAIPVYGGDFSSKEVIDAINHIEVKDADLLGSEEIDLRVS